eukprot:COSAG04_NODE_6199_length_1386_cov_1.272727_1_plen_235_part_00
MDRRGPPHLWRGQKFFYAAAVAKIKNSKTYQNNPLLPSTHDRRSSMFAALIMTWGRAPADNRRVGAGSTMPPPYIVFSNQYEVCLYHSKVLRGGPNLKHLAERNDYLRPGDPHPPSGALVGGHAGPGREQQKRTWAPYSQSKWPADVINALKYTPPDASEPLAVRRFNAAGEPLDGGRRLILDGFNESMMHAGVRKRAKNELIASQAHRSCRRAASPAAVLRAARWRAPPWVMG